ncbi:MAG TPA: phosphatase PAP2 family protein [Candidatus Limnocylindrales bacterium]|nr:phosphatase PAP2 family protein [Candidatus Limnocylindrales bacterium]
MDLAALDRQVYAAIVSATQSSRLIEVLVVTIAWINWNGLVWWLAGLLLSRARGFSRRGRFALLTLYIGMVDGWLVSEILKLVFRRPRPFTAIVDAPVTLIDHPSSFSFPSGDATFAVGAAVALGIVAPRWRWPAYLFAIAVMFERVAVGVHYPSDVLAGAVVGTISGLLAPRAVALVRRRLRWRVFVVPHTHWDREWYERFEGYRARLVPMVSKLLDLLERDPEFRSFTFDGQTIAIEDHLEKRPDDRARIAALVKADRLFVGPWYVLADNILVSGESVVRNFQEGLRVAQSFGRALRVGYVADPFGHPAQVPQILRGFGYGTYVFSRGIGDEGEALGAEFVWQSPSGDRVLASHLVDHYSGGLALVGEISESKADLVARVRRKLPRMLDIPTHYANSSTLLFMEGDDHVEAYERLPEAIAALEKVAPNLDVRIASLEDYAAVVPMPPTTHTGEIVSGRYRPILRGVNSTRVWIKQENAICERLLIERCEPLDAMTGGGERDAVRSLWRTLLQNHPHDSICGCSIDAVHDVDMAPRFARVRADGVALAERLERRLVGDGDRALAWNDLPWERDAVVDVDTTPTRVRCAAMGASGIARAEGAATASSPEDGVIENEHLRVEVATNATFVIIDKTTGTRTGRQNLLVDDGDRGDEYTYSYAGPTLDAQNITGARRTQVTGDRATVTVELTLDLPVGLRDDRLARSAALASCRVRAEISLDAGARRVEVAMTVENAARDHRLRVLFETGTRALTHVGGAAFAWLDRTTRVAGRSGWIEQPTAERCAHDLVAIDGALAVGLDGLREYAVLHDGRTIAITLLRAVGWLSRGDMPERRGHAGPALETPSAQCIGERAYRYCVVPLSKDTTLAVAGREVREFLDPVRVVRGAGPTAPLFELPRDSIVQPSALRAGPEGTTVVRLFNPRGGDETVVLRFARPVIDGRAVDLREGDIELGNTGFDVIRTAAPPLIAADGSVTVRLLAYEIATFAFRLGRG